MKKLLVIFLVAAIAAQVTGKKNGRGLGVFLCTTCKDRCTPYEIENPMGLCDLGEKCCQQRPKLPRPQEVCWVVGGTCRPICPPGSYDDHSGECPNPAASKCCRPFLPPVDLSSSAENNPYEFVISCSEVGGKCRRHCKPRENEEPDYHCSGGGICCVPSIIPPKH